MRFFFVLTFFALTANACNQPTVWGNPDPLPKVGKFVGNVIPGGVPGSWNLLWNQVTPENSGKWGSVEATRDAMNWTGLDLAYNHALSRGIPFKQHAFVWNNQKPGWIDSLAGPDQAAEVEEWIAAYAARYAANTHLVDVVNEPLHAPPSFAAALGGGQGTTWAWVVWSFQKARQYLPNAKLLINEYGTENDGGARDTYQAIIDVLKAQGLVDGIGLQAHAFNLDNMSAAQMTACLNDYMTQKLPIYISELDIRGIPQTSDAQAAKYAELFPAMFQHPNVVGITLWGYIQGDHWMANAELVTSLGVERPALTWLRTYLTGFDDYNSTITVRALGADGSETIELKVGGVSAGVRTLTTAWADYAFATTLEGEVTVHFTNDGAGRDARIDYVIVNGNQREAENQPVNTGDAAYSEWLYTDGYIWFYNTP